MNQYKQRVDFVIGCIISAHEDLRVGSELISERFLVVDTGIGRQTLREAFAVLQYHGFISCVHGKSKTVLRDLAEWDNVKV